MARGERAGRDDLIAAGEGDVDRLYTPLARGVYEALAPYRDQPKLEIIDYALVMRGVEAALAGVFGAFSGDERAPLYQLVVRRAGQEWGRLFETHAAHAQSYLQRDGELQALVEQRATEPGIPIIQVDTETWVDPRGRQLLDRVWVARTALWRQLDQEVRVALVMAEPPAQLALRLRRWLSPAQSHKRNRLGVLQ